MGAGGAFCRPGISRESTGLRVMTPSITAELSMVPIETRDHHPALSGAQQVAQLLLLSTLN